MEDRVSLIDILEFLFYITFATFTTILAGMTRNPDHPLGLLAITLDLVKDVLIIVYLFTHV